MRLLHVKGDPARMHSLAVEGIEIKDWDLDACMVEDCYSEGASVCDANDGKVTMCYEDFSKSGKKSTIKEKCDDPWWRPGGNDEFLGCGTCGSRRDLVEDKQDRKHHLRPNGM